MVNRIGGTLLEGLFPNYCALCGLRSYRTLPLCAACEGELPVNHTACLRCAIPLLPTAVNDQGRLCGACLHQPPAYHRTIAPWLYSEQMAYLIQRWKYGGQQRFTSLLVRLWLQRIEVLPDVDLIMPVPLHWRRLLQRGFNQSELLCRRLRASCPKAARPRPAYRCARRVRSTAAQSGMNAHQRALNLRGAFTLNQRYDNLRIAIVDDVMTTGATAASLADALAQAGATHIELWCLARTAAPHQGPRSQGERHAPLCRTTADTDRHARPGR